MMTSSHSDRDAEVRAALAGRGDDGQTPRHTVFYFYGGNLLGLDSAATSAGYSVRPTAQHDGIVLETTTGVDQQNYEIHRQRMESWAERFGCEYDGWESQLVAQ